MIKLEFSDPSEMSKLLSADEYTALIG
jgi:hypothetical protein